MSSPIKDVRFNEDAKAPLINGINTVCNAVSTTMGYRGRTVLIESAGGFPNPTKDGVSVAKSIFLDDAVESLGCEFIKQACQKTVDEAGDGPQPLYSKILTTSGWKTMGEMEVGSEICGTNGTKQNVVGVFPKGEMELYKVYFSDKDTPAFDNIVLKGADNDSESTLYPTESFFFKALIELNNVIPPPITTPSEIAALTAWIASSTLSIFSFNSDSVFPPTFTIDTPQANLATLSFKYSFSSLLELFLTTSSSSLILLLISSEFSNSLKNNTVSVLDTDILSHLPKISFGS